MQSSLAFYDKTPQGIIFQWDNNPKSTCKKAPKWLQGNDMQVLLWPAQSPDINTIEHVWNHLERKLADTVIESPPDAAHQHQINIIVVESYKKKDLHILL